MDEHKFRVGQRVKVVRGGMEKKYGGIIFIVMLPDKVMGRLYYRLRDPRDGSVRCFYETSLSPARPLPNHRKEIKDG